MGHKEVGQRMATATPRLTSTQVRTLMTVRAAQDGTGLRSQDFPAGAGRAVPETWARLETLKLITPSGGSRKLYKPLNYLLTEDGRAYLAILDS